ncbi:MAG TPA: metallopeptidase family protein [Candidatus Saccharimonadia bacterium]|nr:metallopeptidase family protein [Candidatus Saccharimonadia bacterium]
MIGVSDEAFYALVQEAVTAIPERFAKHLNNVAFMVADEPTREQLGVNLRLHRRGMTLLGLYEGIPLPRRGDGYSGVLPDVITVFRGPHLAMAHDVEGLRRDVRQTVWHEVAHYFGLDHGQIRALEE